VGQPVRFFADAFPYQRYGTLAGKLTWISPSAVVSHDTQQFVAEATLDRVYFDVAGRPHPLQVGMGGEARVEVGSRTPIEFVLEPIRQLRENLGRSPP
jgi:HlyD family secretion protein